MIGNDDDEKKQKYRKGIDGERNKKKDTKCQHNWKN